MKYVVETFAEGKWWLESEHDDENHASLAAGELIEAGTPENEVRVRPVKE